MKHKLGIVIIISLLSISVRAQEAKTTISKVFLDFVENTPSVISITSPTDMIAQSRGFKPVTSKMIEILGTVSDAEGVQELQVNGDRFQVNPEGKFTANVPLTIGMNTIIFSVLDKKKNLTEKIYQLERKLEEIPTPAGGNYYALLIGIQNYDDPFFPDLDHPIEDVQTMYNVLVNQYAFNDERVSMVLDPTREDMMNALDELSKKVSPIDNVLIFYAGHGTWDEESEIGYWLPKNANKDKKAEWFRNSAIRDYIKEIKSKHTLLIADACFSGSIFKSRSGLVGADLAINKLHELPSRKAMTSGTLNAVPDKSVFFKFLIKRLKENPEKYISSGQLFSSFRIAVINNGDAIPQYGTVQNSGDEGGEFIFIRRD